MSSKEIDPRGVELDIGSNDELDDLDGCQDHREKLWHPNPKNTNNVVEVHERVDVDVHQSRDEEGGIAVGEGVKSHQKCQDVMEPVEKYKLGFPEDYEDGVTVLCHFAKGEEEQPERGDASGRVVVWTTDQ